MYITKLRKNLLCNDIIANYELYLKKHILCVIITFLQYLLKNSALRTKPIFHYLHKYADVVYRKVKKNNFFLYSVYLKNRLGIGNLLFKSFFVSIEFFLPKQPNLATSYTHFFCDILYCNVQSLERVKSGVLRHRRSVCENGCASAHHLLPLSRILSQHPLAGRQWVIFGRSGSSKPLKVGIGKMWAQCNYYLCAAHKSSQSE